MNKDENRFGDISDKILIIIGISLAGLIWLSLSNKGGEIWEAINSIKNLR